MIFFHAVHIKITYFLPFTEFLFILIVWNKKLK